MCEHNWKIMAWAVEGDYHSLHKCDKCNAVLQTTSEGEKIIDEK